MWLPVPSIAAGRRPCAALASCLVLAAASGAGAAERPAFDAFLGLTPIFLEDFESGECASWSATSSPLSAPDVDEDAFGDELQPTVNCQPPPGFVLDLTDCDDTDPNVFPGAPELCNGVDDDCDDVVDQFDEACYSGPPGTLNVGVCVAGVSTCAGGQWGPCVGEVLPTPEVCNGLDDDCNGTDDDGIVSDTNPVCAAHTYLGAIAGDTGAAQVGAMSFDERFYRVTLQEQNAGTVPVLARVQLQPTAAADFDLYVYCLSCGGTLAGSSTLGPGVADTVDVGRDDGLGDQSYDILIEVRFASANPCGFWTLTVTGNVPNPNRACN